jgi:hypothetical protein
MRWKARSGLLSPVDEASADHERQCADDERAVASRVLGAPSAARRHAEGPVTVVEPELEPVAASGSPSWRSGFHE